MCIQIKTIVLITDLSDKKELEDKLRLAIEENESLRKGLHEVLESIQKQDGKDINYLSYQGVGLL